ncbi:MAG: ATP-binding cassette domain-containing protein [Pseudomonadota bacterium]
MQLNSLGTQSAISINQQCDIDNLSLIHCVDVIAGYQTPVVGPVSFSVKPNEKLIISGTNGCGKSTLLKMIIGSANLLEGKVLKADGLTVAYQPQSPKRLAEMPITGYEYLRLMSPADTTAIPEQLRRYLHRRVDQLSGGQFQLLSTWSNLSSNNALVLLDEPTNNLDKKAVNILIDCIEQMPANHGLIIVSHDSKFIQQINAFNLELSPWS